MEIAGSFDSNLKELEKISGAKIYFRGNSIVIKGDKDANEKEKDQKPEATDIKKTLAQALFIDAKIKDVELTEDNWKEVYVREATQGNLKQACTANAISTAGSKADMMARLVVHLEAANEG